MLPLGFVKSFIIYVVAGIVLFLATHFLIPYLSRITEIEPIFFWFIVAGILIFTPLLILSFFILKNEKLKLNREVWKSRLRFNKLNKRDWIWTITSIVIVIILSGSIMFIIEKLYVDINTSPDFMILKPLTPSRYWLSLVWLPYWLLNIMGEEIFWRGVMLPRQEIAFGKYAWLIHGCGWTIFHIAFGWQLLLTMLPLLFILPYVVQKRKNSWIGVILHAIINGPSFIAIAFGLL